MAITGREISITVIAALLTLAGFSINDTIVIFDRIRENIRLRGRSNKETLEELINRSCNETLVPNHHHVRDGVSGAHLFVVVRRGSPEGFSLALTFGVVVGSYSTIFIATPMVFLWQMRRTKSLR
jgi:preprotein translocase subunit SecF